MIFFLQVKAQKERYVLAQANRELASLNAEPIESTDSSNDGSHFDNGGESVRSDKYLSSPRNSHYGSNDRVSSNRGSESRDTHLNTNSSIHNDEDSRSSMRSTKSINSPGAGTPPVTAPVISLNLGANAKKKRLEVKDIFNNDEDSEDVNGPKKRKLVPLG